MSLFKTGSWLMAIVATYFVTYSKQDCADRHAPIKRLNANEVKFISKPWINPDLAKMV